MTQSKNIEMDVEITPKSKRLISIDALRGFVMIIMIIDHVRETFFLHMQVGDPVDVLTTSPELFFTRWVSSICAPVFIFLTGLSAWLYSQKHSKNDTAIFLLKRGMFLVLLEVTIISFLWSGKYPPDIFFLQVIWCIGLCMIALAGLIYLPRYLQIVIGAIIIAGHNLLDQIILTSDAPLFIPWAILYQRAMIDFGGGIIARTSYPLLPWMGVILIGYTAGSWFSKDMSKETRAKQLMISGMALILAFIVIRALNFYGDSPWFITESTLTTFMSFISLTKYPPSLLFSLSMLGLGALLLVLFEKWENKKVTLIMSHFGAAPMFFYILHLFILKIMYLVAFSIYGATDGQYFAFSNVSTIWVTFFLLLVPLYYPTRWFAELKQKRRDIWWLKYL